MNRFVKCVDCKSGDSVWLNISSVKVVRQVDRIELADIVEDFDGNMYECTYTDSNGFTHKCFRSCIIDV